MIDHQRRRILYGALVTAASTATGSSIVRAEEHFAENATVEETLWFLSSVANLQILAGGFCAVSSLTVHILLEEDPEYVNSDDMARFCPSRIFMPLYDDDVLQQVRKWLGDNDFASILEKAVQRIAQVVEILDNKFEERNLNYSTARFSTTSEPIIHVERMLLAYSMVRKNTSNETIQPKGICEEVPFDKLCEWRDEQFG